MHLIINPAWYQTLIFKFLVIVLFIGGVVLVFGLRIREIKKQRESLSKKVAERTYEITVKNKLLEEQAKSLNESNSILEEKQEEVKMQAEELKAQKDSLEETNKKLHELNLTKDKFFSIIAHDLKSPFSNLIGFLSLLNSRVDSYERDKIKKFVKLSYQSSTKIYNLLDDLLKWSRSQLNVIEIKKQKVDIRKIINANTKFIENAAENKNVEIRINLQEEISISTDENMVNTIIRNLLSNAVKFSHSNGVVTISGQKAGREIIISIKDSGVGLSNDDIGKLFRVDVPTQQIGESKEKGTGLGLIICKDFVEQLGGKIWVESELGNGSTFKFSLPLNHNNTE